jgi:hypothetical protein
MELLDRYLQAVRKHLPWKRQEDIIAELRTNLESQLDEKQDELGRPMTPAEAETWIMKLGSPMQMASHYQPQRYLIGPTVFPSYLHVLRLASTWAAVLYLLVNAINLFTGTTLHGTAVASVIFNLPFVLVEVAAWVTLVFAGIEFTAAHFPDKCPNIGGFHAKWSPRDLPPLQPIETPNGKRRTYAQAMAEAAFGFVVLGWLLLVPQNPYLMFGPGVAYLNASPYLLAPVWMTAYWWIVGLNAVQLTWRCLDLLRGTWQRPDLAQHIIFKSVGLVPLLILANAHDRIYLLLKRPDIDSASYGATVQGANQGIHTLILILCVIVSAQLAWDIAQSIIEVTRKRATSS